MAATPRMSLVLPVRIGIGEHTADVGSIEIDATQQIAPQIADAMRELADAIRAAVDAPDEEVNPDGTA